MSTPTINISRNDGSGWNITHDGHDIALAINARPAPTLSLDLDVPVLTASLAVDDIEVNGATLELRVPGHVRDALVAAGWTEPKEGDPMSAQSIPGVDPSALVDALRLDAGLSDWKARHAADVALAHIAAHHECVCDRERTDEWVEVDTLDDLPKGVRARVEWGAGDYRARYFFHRDDLPADPDADLVERMARALFASDPPNGRWEGWSEDVQERYRKAARAALAVVRDAEEAGR